MHTAEGPSNVKKKFRLIFAFLFLGLSLTQIIFMFHSLKVRKLAILRDNEVKLTYQKIRHAAYFKDSDQCTIKNLKCLENLDKDLSRNNDK